MLNTLFDSYMQAFLSAIALPFHHSKRTFVRAWDIFEMFFSKSRDSSRHTYALNQRKNHENIFLILFVVTTLTAVAPTWAECPSKDSSFCSTYKLADQGDATAQYNLGWMYDNGEGVITDMREAYIWFSISKANGYENVAEIIELIHDDDILTETEIKSARREAARRLQAIEPVKEQGKADSAENASLDNIALAESSKSTNIAEQVFEKSWRSVVVIINNDSQGSGVIVRPNVVATNCHVVDEGGSITVYKANNRRVDTTTSFTAVIRHTDSEQDFCILDVDGLWGIPATIRKYDTLRVGENVYSLGAPQGLDLSLSAGLVSQLREIKGSRVIQTDAAISPGSSGGGLFDGDGNLVGITTFKFVDENVEGIGFAIPADLVLDY